MALVDLLDTFIEMDVFGPRETGLGDGGLDGGTIPIVVLGRSGTTGGRNMAMGVDPTVRPWSIHRTSIPPLVPTCRLHEIMTNNYLR